MFLRATNENLELKAESKEAVNRDEGERRGRGGVGGYPTPVIRIPSSPAGRYTLYNRVKFTSEPPVYCEPFRDEPPQTAACF